MAVEQPIGFGGVESAAYWGCRRCIYWVSTHREHRWGRNDNPWTNWIGSAGGEIGMAMWLNTFWIPFELKPSDVLSDVGSGDDRIQVKTGNSEKDGFMRLRPDDQEKRLTHRFYYTLAHRMLSEQLIVIVGYMDGADAFVDKYFHRKGEYVEGRHVDRDAWWIPAADLVPVL